MTNANCPSCGAPIEFRWSGAVQTVCPYCSSILVRHDLDLKLVGEVANIPQDASPIQIGTEGSYSNAAFQVVGRIAYEYEHGGWNEWHLLFNDGRSGWLADAQLEYAVSFLSAPDPQLVAPGGLWPGKSFTLDSATYEVTTVTEARYAGVQGELPFEYWGKEKLNFVDLRSSNDRFATIDYSENPPLLFLGEAVEFDSLELTNLREFEGWS